MIRKIVSLGPISRLPVKVLSGGTWSGRFPASLLCSFAAAVGSHYLIEKPFFRIKRRLSPTPIAKGMGAAQTSACLPTPGT